MASGTLSAVNYSLVFVNGTLTVTPATLTVTADIAGDGGGSIALQAIGVASDINVNAATVSSTGVVTAVAAGTVTITATSEGKSGTASITVTVAPVATVTVTPPASTVIVGATQALTATTYDATSTVLPRRSVMPYWNGVNGRIAPTAKRSAAGRSAESA